MSVLRRQQNGPIAQPRRRVGPSAWIALLAVLMVLAPLGLPSSGAAFSDTSSNTVNSFSAATLTPPTGLGLVSSCTGGTPTQPTLVGTGTPAQGSADVIFNRPAAVVGDLVVAILTAGSSAAPAHELAGGFTFTSAASGAVGSLVSIHVLYRRVAVSEPTTYQFDPAAGTTAGVIQVYRNVDVTAPFGARGTLFAMDALTNGGITTTAPGLTTTTASNLVLVVQAIRLASGAAPLYTNPTGSATTDATNIAVASNGTATGRVSNIAMPAAGATGDTSIDHAHSDNRVGFQIPVLPSSPGGITASWTTTNVSAWADGYELKRINGGVTEATLAIVGRTTSSYLDSGVANGTYTYTLSSTASSWRSSTINNSVTRSC